MLHGVQSALEVAFQTMVDGMVLVDSEGRITLANKAAERILGIDIDAIQARTCQAAEWHPVDAGGDPFPSDRLPLAMALRDQVEVHACEHGIVLADGSTRWLTVNAAPLIGEAHHRAARGAGVDRGHPGRRATFYLPLPGHPELSAGATGSE